MLISKLYQHFRERDLPYGLQDALSTLSPSCSSSFQRLRHGPKTRYGWVANPYPTGTFTRQEAPSFSQRDNGQANRRAIYRESVLSDLLAVTSYKLPDTYL